MPQLAANGQYLTLCLNSYEPLSSLNAHRSKYVRMVADHARTYGPGGSFWISNPSIAQYAVQTFELMNEPYGWWYRNNDNDPAAYAQIAAAAIRKGHAANPNAKFYVVLAPDPVLLANGDWIDWNTALLAAVPNLFDLHQSPARSERSHPRTNPLRIPRRNRALISAPGDHALAPRHPGRYPDRARVADFFA